MKDGILVALKNYERLSEVYDLEWGRFSQQYSGLISELLSERAITRAKVLDIACGTGGLAVELAKSGHSVYGLDISPQMIRKAKSKSMGLSAIAFEVQDMREFSVPDHFDLVVCAFDSVNYLLDPGAVRQTFLRVAEALRDSGLFAFDSNTDRLYVNRHKGEHRRELGGEVFMQKCVYNPKKPEAKTIFEFSDGEREIHIQRPYDLPELEPLLSEAGLQVIRTFADFDRTPFDSGSERLICVAEKGMLGKDR
jgi:SAM-dependent methyltransferase